MPEPHAIPAVSIGYDNSDVEALNVRRVPLMYTPIALVETVADTVTMLVLSTVCQVVEVAERVKVGE